MTIELINADIVAAHLLAIPQKIRVAVETKAVREASKVIVGQFRQNAPVETGALQKSLKFDVRKYRGGNIVVGLIGADNDFVGTVERNKKGKKVFKRNQNATANRRRPSKYLHLVNLGTKRGVPALHFKEKTEEQVAGQVQQILTNAVQEALR